MTGHGASVELQDESVERLVSGGAHGRDERRKAARGEVVGSYDGGSGVTHRLQRSIGGNRRAGEACGEWPIG